MNTKNPTIIVGHYGSGKTEFAVNYAVSLHETESKTVVADMDIVNPYFRARELKDFLGRKGIEVISSNFENDYYNDTPALAASLKSCFEMTDRISVIDVGGDSAGATVLARYARLLLNRGYNMWITVNANRPETATAEEAARFIGEIEATSRLKINGIVNTTHMLRETTSADILKGDALARELSELSKIKVIYTVIEDRLIAEMKEMNLAGEPFPIKLVMRPKWM